jgi:hypothetical protein
MNMDEKEIKKDLTTLSNGIMQNNDSEYVRLVSQISGLWEKAKEKAVYAVNTELLKASWGVALFLLPKPQTICCLLMITMKNNRNVIYDS